MPSLVKKSVLILCLIIAMISKLPSTLSHNAFMVSGLRGIKDLRTPSKLRNRYSLPWNCTEEFHQQLTNRLLTGAPANLSTLRWLAVCRYPVEDLNLQIHAENPLYWLFAGWISANTEGLDKAALIWRDQPELSAYFANLAVSLADQNSFGDAVFYSQLFAITNVAETEQNASYYYVLCSYLVEKERYDDALVYCRNFAQIEPSNGAFFQLGRVYYQLGNYVSAYESFSRGDKVIHLVWQAKSKYALGDLAAAESLFIEALDKDPENRPASVYLIELYLDSERPCDAQRILQNWLAGESCELTEKGVPKKLCLQSKDHCKDTEIFEVE